MEPSNQSTKIAQLDQDLSSFLKKLDGNIIVDRSLIQRIKDLQDLIKRGYCLGIVACGPTNSGKSTLLNYLISAHSSNKLNNLHLFPTGSKVETSTPWLLTVNKNNQLDSIEISHISTSDGKEHNNGIFDEISKALDFMKENYSRKAIEEKQGKENNYLKPYSWINLALGMQYGSSTKLFSKELFASDCSIVDLQGFNEPGAFTVIKNMRKPFILICCFDETTQFLYTSSMEQFLEIVNDSKPDHVIFVTTHITNSIQNMLSEMNPERQDEENENIENECFEELKKSIKETLEKKQLEIQWSLYFFDPWSKFTEARNGAQRVRNKLIELRAEFHLRESDCKEITNLIHKNLQSLKTKLIFETLIRESSLNKQYEDHQNELKKSCERLAIDLEKFLKTSFDTDLINKMKELAQKREKLFKEEGFEPKDLMNKFKKWVVNDGIQVALTEVLIEKVPDFETITIQEAKNIFEKVFQDLNSQDKIEIPDVKMIDLEDELLEIRSSPLFLRFHLFSPFAKILLEFALKSPIFTFSFSNPVLSFYTKVLTKTNSETDLILWYLEPTFHKKAVIEKICQLASRDFLKRWQKKSQSMLKMVYVETCLREKKNLDAIQEDLAKKNISLDELNEIVNNFRLFRDCLT